MKSPVTLLSSLFDDVKRLEPSVKGFDRDIRTVETRFKHEGYGFFAVTLLALGDAFDLGISTGQFTCPTSFGKVRGQALPKFLSGLLCKVFDTKTGLLLECASVHAIKCVREILRLFKKLKLSPKRSEKLARQAIAKFVSTDEYIKTVSYCPNRSQFVRSVSKVLLPNLDGFDSTRLLYKHGPGGVAEKVKSNSKWVRLIEELKHNASLAALMGYDLKFLSNFGITDHDEPWRGLPLFETSCFHRAASSQHASEGVAKLLTVVKDSTSLRTITAEPVIKQFFQQGLNTYLRDSIRKCGVLSHSLALSNQSENQVLALEGSLNCKYATLDLSSASDLLSVDLVGLVFSARPVFFEYALKSRSAYVDTGSSGILELQKFAGMGNALTFPVQSVVFATLAICAILHTEGKDPSYVNAQRASRRVRVYGDDIIVETHIAHQVVDWLTSFGLKVNQKKSFLAGNFKESCGVDAWKGYDVTPTYVKHELVVSERNPDQIASLVSTSNQLWMKGLYSAAEYVRSCVESFIRLPICSARSSSLGWHSRVDTTVARKWDRKLQRLVFRGFCVEATHVADDISSDNASLMKSLTLLNNRGRVFDGTGYANDEHQLDVYVSDPENLQRSVRRFNTRIRARWVPAEAGVKQQAF